MCSRYRRDRGRERGARREGRERREERGERERERARPSTYEYHFFRSKSFWALKRSNLLLVAVDARGITADLHRLLSASGCFERIIAKADDYKAILLQLHEDQYLQQLSGDDSNRPAIAVRIPYTPK